MKRVFIYPLVILTIAIVTLFIVFSRGALTVANNTPYAITFAYSYSPNPYDMKVKGWFDLKPGEKKKFKHIYRGKSPSFTVHAKSSNSDLIKWIYDLPNSHPGVLYFEEDENARTRFFNVEEQDFDYKIENYSDSLEHHLNVAGFAPVKENKKGNAVQIIKDDSFEGFLGVKKMPNEKYIDSVLVLAPILAESLRKQKIFNQKYNDPAYDFPFHFGLNLNDFNGYDVPGIAIERVNANKAIEGTRLPYKENDIILAMNGVPVFSHTDLFYLLGVHGNSIDKGIEVPLELDLLRDKNVYRVKASYFFNENYFGRSKEDKSRASSYGIGDTFFWGGAPTGATVVKNIFKGLANALNDGSKKKHKIGNFKTERWQYAQYEMRLRQMYPKEFNAGGFIGMFISPGQAFTKTAAKSLIKRGVSKRAAYVTAAVSIELAEGVVWTINDSSPILSTSERISNVKNVIPEALGIGLLSGSLIKKSKIKNSIMKKSIYILSLFLFIFTFCGEMTAQRLTKKFNNASASKTTKTSNGASGAKKISNLNSTSTSSMNFPSKKSSSSISSPNKTSNSSKASQSINHGSTKKGVNTTSGKLSQKKPSQPISKPKTQQQKVAQNKVNDKKESNVIHLNVNTRKDGKRSANYGSQVTTKNGRRHVTGTGDGKVDKSGKGHIVYDKSGNKEYHRTMKGEVKVDKSKPTATKQQTQIQNKIENDKKTKKSEQLSIQKSNDVKPVAVKSNDVSNQKKSQAKSTHNQQKINDKKILEQKQFNQKQIEKKRLEANKQLEQKKVEKKKLEEKKISNKKTIEKKHQDDKRFTEEKAYTDKKRQEQKLSEQARIKKKLNEEKLIDKKKSAEKKRLQNAKEENQAREKR